MARGARKKTASATAVVQAMLRDSSLPEIKDGDKVSPAEFMELCRCNHVRDLHSGACGRGRCGARSYLKIKGEVLRFYCECKRFAKAVR